MLDGRPKTDLMGGEGGGLEATDVDGVAGAGGMGSAHPGTGGAPRMTATAGETVVTSSVTGANGTCKAPCGSYDVGAGVTRAAVAASASSGSGYHSDDQHRDNRERRSG